MRSGSSRLARRFRTEIGLIFLVNPNHVITDFRVKYFAVGPHEEHAGVLQGHVAVDAVGRDLVAEFGKFAALLGFVAGQTTRREGGGITLRHVNIVAGAAGQSCGGLKAFALAQHLDLIAVNVDGLVCADIGNVDVVAEIVSRQKRQRGTDRGPVAGMAEAADVELAVAFEFGGIHNRF